MNTNIKFSTRTNIKVSMKINTKFTAFTETPMEGASSIQTSNGGNKESLFSSVSLIPSTGILIDRADTTELIRSCFLTMRDSDFIFNKGDKREVALKYKQWTTLINNKLKSIGITAKIPNHIGNRATSIRIINETTQEGVVGNPRDEQLEKDAGGITISEMINICINISRRDTIYHGKSGYKNVSDWLFELIPIEFKKKSSSKYIDSFQESNKIDALLLQLAKDKAEAKSNTELRLRSILPDFISFELLLTTILDVKKSINKDEKVDIKSIVSKLINTDDMNEISTKSSDESFDDWEEEADSLEKEELQRMNAKKILEISELYNEYIMYC